MKFVILIILVAGGIWFYQQNNAGSATINIQKTDLSTQTQGIISKAQETPQIKDIQDFSGAFYKAGDKEVRAFLARLISLGLMVKDPNAFRHFKIAMEEKYPNEGYFDFIDKEFPSICTKWDGKGGDSCSKCKGTRDKAARLYKETLNKFK